MPTTIPLDDLDLGALEAVLTGQSSTASAALAEPLAEALTAQAESCPDCSATEGDLCGPRARLTERAVTQRERPGQPGRAVRHVTTGPATGRGPQLVRHEAGEGRPAGRTPSAASAARLLTGWEAMPPPPRAAHPGPPPG